MGRWADIVTAVREAVGDATEAQAQRWVLQGARLLNAESKFFTVTTALTTTVADTAAYTATAGVVDIDAVLVDGQPYENVSRSQYEGVIAGHVYASGARWYTTNFTSAGVLQIVLYPTPSESGLAITVREVKQIVAPTWASDDPVFPEDFDYALENAGIAIGKARLDEELVDADWFRGQFEGDILRLKRRRSGRSGGVRQIGIAGYHF